MRTMKPRSFSYFLVLISVLLLPQPNVHAAAPAYRASGTFTSGTGDITPPYPAGFQANDICLLAVESENEAIGLATANGFVEVPTWSPQSGGTAATNPASRLALFWKRAVGGDTAPVVTDAGNHTTGQVHCFSGVITSGNPWDTGAGGNDGGANDTTGTIPGATTASAETLVVLITSTSFNGTSTANCSAWTNADLTSLTERTDNTNTAGLGGGHCLATGVKTTAGAYATTTVTLASTTFKGAISLALKPVPPSVVSINRVSAELTSPSAAVSWTVIFSESMTGVDATDFALAVSGVSGASITGVAGSGTTWTVTANSGTGVGTLGLNLVDDDTIVNSGATPLGGTGVGNGNFTGQTYAVSSAPYFLAAGTADSGTGTVSPAWPAHVVGDVALLFVESTGGEPVTLSTAAGFVAVPNSPQATGAGTAGTQITVFWARATSAAMTAPTIADAGNHVYAQILTYGNVITGGDPWDVTGGGVKGAASTSVTVTGVTTTLADTLIVQAVARDNDSAAPAFSAQSNMNLAGIGERSDAGTISGNGGGFAVWDGVKLMAGATGSTTATVTSSVNAFLTIALKKRTFPIVTSISRASTDPAESPADVSWTVVFSDSVTGVDATDFALAASGLTGQNITSVTGSGTTWTVTANTGTGVGTLGLNLIDDDTIINSGLIPLGGTGAANGNFNGEVYTVTAPVAGAFNACDVGASCTNTTPSTYIKTKIAGSAFSLDLAALKTDGTRNTSYNSTVLVELLDSSDNSGVLDTDKCRSTWSVIATLSPNPAFAPADNGLITVGTFTVANAYPNVRVRVTNVGGPSRRGCSTDNFAIRPNTFAGFAVSDNGTWDTAGTSRALADVTVGSVVHKAGRPISVRANAMNAAGSPAITTNYVGAPTATITACAGAACTGTFGSIALNTTFAAGQLASDVATYDNVGAFALELVDSAFAVVDDVDGSTAVQREIRSGAINVGRFVPDHFTLGSISLTPRSALGCSPASTFSYMGENFVIDYTLTAEKYPSGTTTLYDGSRLPLATPAYLGFGARNGTTDLSSRISALSGSGSWSNGVTSGAFATLLFTRNVMTPDGPYATLNLGMVPQDLDSVTLDATALNLDVNNDSTPEHQLVATTSVRFGRLRLLNAYGSELLPLRLPVRAEYFNGTTWALNAADSCTSLLASAVALSGGIAANTSASAVALSGGSGTLTLAKPSPVAAGSVDVAANLGITGTPADVSCNASNPPTTAANLAWLQFPWCTGKLDPNARVRFGSPKAPYIYLRERY